MKALIHIAHTAILMTVLMASGMTGAHAASEEEFPAVPELVPAGARPNAPVTERDLAVLLPRLARRWNATHPVSFSVTRPSGAVTRVRALMAVVRLAVKEAEIAAYRDEMPEDLPPDIQQVPLWARPYLAAATVRGWWPVDHPFAPRQTADWRFMDRLLASICDRMDTVDRAGPATRPNASEPDTHYTGLIIDAQELRVERSMCPRLLDENGQVLYPDPKRLPDMDFVQDRGMMTYDTSVETARRAGRNPLIIRAIRTAGPAGTDLVVSAADAERIREANRRGKFLSKWAVSVLVSPVSRRP
ncbi:MAG: hypothetical protein RMJ43_12030 [Chloroherpetonaceae bacterium]|nr:DUF2267 domain-containing protein [Chthonomonadaceae bacterium]MDW8208555.1 hypothetical protein [Chloroherpetonaceae bacterium]